jgi:hypothetical protein
VADGRPATEGLEIAFPVPDRVAVDEFHAAATAAGGPSALAPGERDRDGHRRYCACVLDPDGGRVEAVVACER